MRWWVAAGLLTSLGCTRTFGHRDPVLLDDCHCTLTPPWPMMAREDPEKGRQITFSHPMSVQAISIEFVPRTEIKTISLVGHLDFLGEEIQAVGDPSYTTLAGYPAVSRDLAAEGVDITFGGRLTIVEAPHGRIVLSAVAGTNTWRDKRQPLLDVLQTLHFPAPPPMVPWADEPLSRDPESLPLLDARAHGHAEMFPVRSDPDADVLAAPGFQTVVYPSQGRGLRGLLTVAPGDDAPRPAVLWRGPGTSLAGARAFADAGLVVFAPAVRGEPGNPGTPEYAFGEVDDVLAALDFLRAMPWVDPDQVTLVGEGRGGTEVLLAAVAGAPVRATIALGGRASVEQGVLEPIADQLPFDPQDAWHTRHRSAIHWAQHLEHPVRYLEGDESHSADGFAMARLATLAGADMQAISVSHTDHASMLPIARSVLIPKLLADTPDGPFFALTEAELYEATQEPGGDADVP